MNFSQIDFSVEAPLAHITLNSPETVNALSTTMIGELMDVLIRIAGDEAIKVVIIKAAGKNFCAGHNLKEMVGRGMRENKTLFEQCARMMALIHDIPQPVIARVNGVATAAGCQLVAWCDLALAEPEARFATPGVKIGFFCSTPMVALTRAVGRKAAMEMLLTGRFYSAVEAREMGLINRVVPRENLAAETRELALQIAESSRMAVSVGKQAFYAQIDQSDDAAMAYATRTMAMHLATEDAQEGISAFMEKRKPVWKNR